MEKQKNYEELTIRDHFMFGKICSKPENRKLILDSLLQIDFKEKDGTGIIEKHIQEYRQSKYAKLDLIVEDEDGTIYDAEMQNESKNPKRQIELPRRSRYYQALIDTTFFDSGKDYINLPETYIVFICTFDPFGFNLPIYNFRTICEEVGIPEYNDGAHKIFFNTTANLSELPKNMRNMLEYINTGKTNDGATIALDNEVKEARIREEWRAEYMQTLVHDKDVYRDGFDEGFDNGFSSRQKEIDGLNATIADKDAEIAKLLVENNQLKISKNNKLK